MGRIGVYRERLRRRDPFHPTRRDRWLFGNCDSGAYLQQFAWTKIVRHDLVKGAASPDDPALTEYWVTRRHRGAPPPVNLLMLRQLRRQQGRYPILACRSSPVQSPSNEVEQHLLRTGCWDRIRRRRQPPYTSTRR